MTSIFTSASSRTPDAVVRGPEGGHQADEDHHAPVRHSLHIHSIYPPLNTVDRATSILPLLLLARLLQLISCAFFERASERASGRSAAGRHSRRDARLVEVRPSTACARPTDVFEDEPTE